MDHSGEAFYLGGDFSCSGERVYYYMVRCDRELGRWFTGLCSLGTREVPFSWTRCRALGGYDTLREALQVCEQHAVTFFTLASS